MREQMQQFCNEHPDYEREIMAFKFEATCRYEEQIGKHCEDFTVEEIIEFYTSLQSTSYSVLKVYGSYLSSYCEFVGKPNPNYETVTTEDIAKCVNKELITSKIVTREDLLHIIKDLNNPVEKAVCLCLFEGICGKGYSEIEAITSNDITGNIIKLNSGRILEISDELKRLILSSCKTNTYFSYTEHEGMAEKKYIPGNKKMVKELCNIRTAHPDDPHTIRKRIYTIIYRAHNMTGSDSIDATNLRESGRIDMIKKLLATGKSIEEVLRNLDLERRYGRIGNKKYYMELYKDYIRED